jgi:phage terminase large subunit-like protein
MSNFEQYRDRFQKIPVEQRREKLNLLSKSEKLLLTKYPNLFLFDKQVIPEGDWRYFLLRCGRSFGKTVSGSAWIANKIIKGAKVVGLCGPTYDDVAKVMIPAILKWFPELPKESYNHQKHVLTFPNGSQIHCYTSDKEIRGPNLEFLWCDEICVWCDSIPEKVQERFDLIDMSVRVGKNPQTIITSTPKPFPIFITYEKKCRDNPNVYQMSTGTMFDNPFLPKSFLDAQIEKHGSTRLGRQEIYGELLTDQPGALWNNKILDDCRIEPSDFNSLINDQKLFIYRIVIAVDPAITANTNSDETGIIVAALCSNNQIYILRDVSGQLTPNQWAQKTIEMYNEYKADRIIAEKNQGGLLVESNIHSVDRYAPVKLVSATKGKIVRAEPVASLYERLRVHHVGYYKELEYQMTHYTGNTKDKSPDRMDALVYAVTELLLSQTYTNRDVTAVGYY